MAKPVNDKKFSKNNPRKLKENTFKAKFKQAPSESSNTSTGNFFIKPVNNKPKPSTSSSNNESPKKTFNNPKMPKSTNKNMFGKRQPALPKDEEPQKIFDKKRYRLQKYSHKYKLEQWEGQRKKKILNEYYKQIKDDTSKFDVNKIYAEEGNEEENDNENNLNTNINQPEIEPPPPPEINQSKSKKKKAFMKAHMEFDRVKAEKQQRREEFEKKKAEREEALLEYKKKKAEKFKKLNKRTKKGQPIMKDRIEMLLEQIQNSINQENQ